MGGCGRAVITSLPLLSGGHGVLSFVSFAAKSTSRIFFLAGQKLVRLQKKNSRKKAGEKFVSAKSFVPFLLSASNKPNTGGVPLDGSEMAPSVRERD